jgi:hypothetical protein
LNPVIPHEGFWKDFKDGKGVDFFHARGYFTFDATRHINLQFGRLIVAASGIFRFSRAKAESRRNRSFP